MTRLIISTCERGAPYPFPSGRLYVVDLESRKVVQQTDGLEPPYREIDSNPRGGMRGMRGLSIRNGELAVANYSSIFFFDRHWNLLRTFSHPSVSAIHEILYVDDGIWVASTANDLLAKFDLSGELSDFEYIRSKKNLMLQMGCSLRQTLQHNDILSGRLDFRRRTYFKSDVYDRVHLNSFALAPDGRLFISLGLIVGEFFSLLVNLKTIMLSLGIWKVFLSLNRFTRKILGLKKKMLSELVVRPARGKSAVISFDLNGEWQVHLFFSVVHNPSHSIRILDDGTGLYLDTSHGEIIHFDIKGNILSSTKVTEKFLRGLLILPNRHLAIGADNVLLIFDLEIKKIVAEIELSEDLKTSIFDIQALSSDFDLPPDSLQCRTGRIVGFAGRDILWEKNPS